MRLLIDLSKFREVIFEMVQDWSLAYTNGLKEIHHLPEIDLEMWTNAYNWAKLNVKMLTKKSQRKVTYRIPSDPKVIHMDDSDSIDWQTFDEFKKQNFALDQRMLQTAKK